MFSTNALEIICIMGLAEYTYQYDNTNRILGGIDARRGEFPFMIGIIYRGTVICGGSLITSSWIITAAHCMFGEIKSYRMMAGTIYRSGGDNAKKRKIQILANHLPSYSENLVEYDISLIKVNEPFKFSKHIQPVMLPYQNQKTEPHTQVTVLGWGRNENDQVEERLKYAHIYIAPMWRCRTQYPSLIHSHHLCAGVLGADRGACRGDSGGPLLVGDLLIGLVSFGPRVCGIPERPLVVFTRVSYFVESIKEVINRYT